MVSLGDYKISSHEGPSQLRYIRFGQMPLYPYPESRNPSRRRETPKWCSNCARTKTSLLVSGLKNLAKGREIERTDIWAVTAGTS